MPHDETEDRNLADGLLSLAKGAGVLPRIEKEAADIQVLVRDREDLRRFMSNPRVEREGKRRALEEAAGKAVHPVLLGFLQMIADLDRLPDLVGIVDAFLERASHLRREVSGELVTAHPLSEAKVREIAEHTGRLLDRRVSLHVRIDRALLGGLLVRVGDVVIDGTIDRRLDDLRQTLSG